MTDATPTTTDGQTADLPDQLTIVEDAATLAYAVYRRVDFDSVDASRSFDDEFVTAIEAATFSESVMAFVQTLADQSEVRAIDAMNGDVRGIVRKYDGGHGRRSARRRFLRVVRQHPAFVVDEMHHAHVGGGSDADDEGDDEGDGTDGADAAGDADGTDASDTDADETEGDA